MHARAAVQTADSTFEIQEFMVPETVGPDEAVLKVEACGVCGSDYEMYRGALARTGLVTYPVIPGHEPVGRIVNIGDRAKQRWAVDEGDRVAVEITVPCGVCSVCTGGRYRLCPNRFLYSLTPTSVKPGLWGGYADYMFLRANTIVHRLPEDLSVEDAVLFNPIGAGFDWMCRVLGTKPGDSVLILGAGQRGLACVVAAMEAGASEVIVTGLARDARKLQLARDFGATHTIDVEEADVIKVVRDITNGNMVDGVIDVTPYATQPILDAIECVKTGGRIVLAGVKGMKEVPGFVSDRLYLKEINMQGIFSVDSWGYKQAIRVISSHRYSLDKMHTHTLPIDDLDHTMRLLGGEIPDEEAIHITVVPPPP